MGADARDSYFSATPVSADPDQVVAAFVNYRREIEFKANKINWMWSEPNALQP